MPGDYLDLSSEARPTPSATPEPRPFLGLNFTCCRVYARIYLTQDGSAFAGHCPRCGGAIRILIADGGATGRFFEAG
jgi:hypothetical protein